MVWVDPVPDLLFEVKRIKTIKEMQMDANGSTKNYQRGPTEFNISK